MNSINPNEVHNVIGKHVLIDPSSLVVDTENSKGSWLCDARNGRLYLDCFSQFASQPIGWNHPKLLANKDRLMKAALHKIANPDILSVEYAEFVKRFAAITPDFKHHFFIDGGALAVENALKSAFDWKLQKLGWNDQSPGEENKANDLDVIHLAEAFHGRSGYTLSLTNRPWDTTKTKWFPKFHWTRVPNPKMHGGDCFLNVEAESLKQIETALQKGNVAALILEPIQGEGGDNHFSGLFLNSLRELTLKYDCMLIFDEVQTGMGMTGKMWAYEHFHTVPDMICFGKKAQVCGFCSTGRIDDVPTNVFHVQSRINSTWGGNFTDMVRSTIFMEIMEEDKLVENADEVGCYFLSKLLDMELKNARGRGLMIAFDLETTEKRNEVLKKLEESMLVLPCGQKSIRIRPHLTFTKNDTDRAVDFIKNAIC
jgi:L-lysine 6-transaminase